MQAVEAKECVEIQNETVTLASISYQNFFRSYPVIATASHIFSKCLLLCIVNKASLQVIVLTSS